MNVLGLSGKDESVMTGRIGNHPSLLGSNCSVLSHIETEAAETHTITSESMQDQSTTNTNSVGITSTLSGESYI